jgi:hypothetical protein
MKSVFVIVCSVLVLLVLEIHVFAFELQIGTQLVFYFMTLNLSTICLAGKRAGSFPSLLVFNRQLLAGSCITTNYTPVKSAEPLEQLSLRCLCNLRNAFSTDLTP